MNLHFPKNFTTSGKPHFLVFAVIFFNQAAPYDCKNKVSVEQIFTILNSSRKKKKRKITLNTEKAQNHHRIFPNRHTIIIAKSFFALDIYISIL